MAKEVVTSKVPAATRHLAEAAAERSGVSLSAFARRALEERAERVLGIGHDRRQREREEDRRGA